jgi:hypothetical protein
MKAGSSNRYTDYAKSHVPKTQIARAIPQATSDRLLARRLVELRHLGTDALGRPCEPLSMEDMKTVLEALQLDDENFDSETLKDQATLIADLEFRSRNIRQV